MTNPIPFAIIGSAWRAEFFLRVAQALPERFEVVGVTSRNPERRAALKQRFGVEVYDDPQALLSRTSPLFVVTSVPRTVSPQVIQQAANGNVPVLAETPPAGTVEAMTDLYALTKRGARIQVAEQYPLQPLHAARLAFAASGKIGTPTYAHVSVAHGYHGIALIRKFLSVGFASPTITARRFASPIVEGPNQNGPPSEEKIVTVSQDLVTFDWGDNLALFDFVGAQYFSYIRSQRLTVRGERGEITDRAASYLTGPRTPVHVRFERHEAGPNGNLEGHHLKGIQAGESWVYENPLAPARLSDDEIAVGTTLLKMAHYVRTGESFYSLAEACQDTYLDLLAQQALASGAAVRAEAQAWAE